MISKEEGQELLRLAKKAVNVVLDKKELEIDNKIERRFSEKQGCFVTIHKDGELRGCIGFPEPVLPLINAIVQAAQAAAFEDPRFMPLSKAELPKCRFEISVLTKPEEIKVNKPEELIAKVRIGTDGLIIRGAFGSGLLLPQVATEWGWGSLEFLENVCRKAGLDKNAWKERENKIYRFQAQIFCEE